jgi:glucose-1-phosphate thymidylyltransferase
MAPPFSVFGLIPAAGRALRLGPLPCSKEILPIGFRPTPAGPAPKVAGHYLLESFAAAGVERVFMVLDESKGDVPRYFGNGALAGVSLAYLMTSGSRSIAHSLDRAFPFVAHGDVVCGFPDVLFTPADAFSRLIERREESGADLVLGLFPARDPRTTDMVELDEEGNVVRLEVRPAATELRFCWLIAAWGPTFTWFVHHLVEGLPEGERELPIGEVVQAAIDSRLHVEGVPFPEGSYRDIGTPAELAAAVRERAKLPGPDRAPR